MTEDNKREQKLAELGSDWLRHNSEAANASDRLALNRARQRALQAMDRPTARPLLGWTLAGASAAAVLAAVLVLREPQLAPPAQTDLLAKSPADDFELLLAVDDLQMIEELEFFELLDLVESQAASSAG